MLHQPHHGSLGFVIRNSHHEIKSNGLRQDHQAPGSAFRGVVTEVLEKSTLEINSEHDIIKAG